VGTKLSVPPDETEETMDRKRIFSRLAILLVFLGLIQLTDLENIYKSTNDILELHCAYQWFTDASHGRKITVLEKNKKGEVINTFKYSAKFDVAGALFNEKGRFIFIAGGTNVEVYSDIRTVAERSDEFAFIDINKNSLSKVDVPGDKMYGLSMTSKYDYYFTMYDYDDCVYKIFSDNDEKLLMLFPNGYFCSFSIPNKKIEYCGNEIKNNRPELERKIISDFNRADPSIGLSSAINAAYIMRSKNVKAAALAAKTKIGKSTIIPADKKYLFSYLIDHIPD
jgi:hypothetical protein